MRTESRTSRLHSFPAFVQCLSVSPSYSLENTRPIYRYHDPEVWALVIKIVQDAFDGHIPNAFGVAGVLVLIPEERDWETRHCSSEVLYKLFVHDYLLAIYLHFLSTAIDYHSDLYGFRHPPAVGLVYHTTLP
jgi:hypothetical protein